MKRSLILCLVTIIAAFCLFACGGSNEPKEKEYVGDNEISSVFTDPDSFKGKYIHLTGEVFTVPEKDNDKVYFQVWRDPENCEGNFIVCTSAEEGSGYSTNDFIEVDGRIDGKFEGSNIFGATVSAPSIVDASIEKSSYIDAVVPTIASIEPAVSASQNDFTVTVDKVEYAADETRIYLTYENNSSDTISNGIYDTKLIMDGKQIEESNSSMTAYKTGQELSYEVLAGTSCSGMLVFPALDQGKDFQIAISSIYSDNYEIEFDDMRLDVVAA